MMMIDKLAYSSPWRYKSVYLKSIFAVGTLFICVAVRSFLISCVILILMGCLTVRYSRASLSRYTRMMMWPFAYHYHRVLADLRPAADSSFAGIGVLPLLSGSDDASSGSDDAFKEGTLPVDPNRTDDVDLPLYFRLAGFGAFYHKRPELQAGK